MSFNTFKKNQHPHDKKFRLNQHSLRVAAIYAIFGGAWILLSDLTLELLVRQHTTFVVFQSIKGLLFILVTSVVVYGLSTRAYKNIEYEALEKRTDFTENLLKKLFFNLGDVIFLIKPPFRVIQECNEAVKPVFGYTKDELVGQNTEILHADTESYRNFGQMSEPVLEQKGIFRTRYRMKKNDGSLIETENTVVALREEEGWRGGVISIVRDITDQVRAQEALRVSEEKHRLLAENSLDVIWSMNLDLDFTYVNPAIKNLTGHTPEEYIGSSLSEHCTPDTLDRLKKVIAREMTKGDSETGTIVQEELLRKDGTPVPVEVHGRILFDENGNPSAIQGTTRDISKRRALEAQIRQSQKMESIGTLASGIAHEINNPVMAITGFADMIAMSTESGEKNRNLAGRIKKETERIHTIIRNLLGFARKETEGPASHVQAGEIIDSTLSLVQTTIRHNHIDLEIVIPGNLPPIFCHKQQVQQVILNLLTNACDALNEKYPGYHDDKKIIIRAGSVEDPARPMVRLTVEDHGPGIRKDLQEKIFEPFYTTKPEGKGTGLGLWIIYGIVQSHGGTVSIEAQEGAFTRVHVDLPTQNSESPTEFSSGKSGMSG